MARRKAPRIPDAILNQLLAGADPKSAFEPLPAIPQSDSALLIDHGDQIVKSTSTGTAAVIGC
jgi:hypothetical protein